MYLIKTSMFNKKYMQYKKTLGRDTIYLFLVYSHLKKSHSTTTPNKIKWENFTFFLFEPHIAVLETKSIFYK